jgi:hypothetical protein
MRRHRRINGTGLSTLYTGGVNGSTPAIVPLVVRVPGGPDTGIVFNNTNGFTVSAGGVTAPAAFIFATLVGTISGWAPNVPLDGDAQLNIQALGGKLYVAYAKVDRRTGQADRWAGGFVNVFDANGNLLDRLIRRDHLRAPWGMVIAPDGFGELSGDLLVGNFGNGRTACWEPSRPSAAGPGQAMWRPLQRPPPRLLIICSVCARPIGPPGRPRR